MDLGVQPHGTIQLEMSSTDPEYHPIRPVKPQQEYNMPDVITVRVQTGGPIQYSVGCVYTLIWLNRSVLNVLILKKYISVRITSVNTD